MQNLNMNSDWDFWFNYPNNKKDNSKEKPIVNPNYYFIFDCITNEILYTSDSFDKILGYSKNDYSFAEIIQFLHPDDCDYVIDCEKKAIEFINNLDKNEQFRYITTYTYRSRTANGNYIRVKQSYHALEVNSEGYMTRAIVYHELIDINEKRKADDFKIFDRQTNKYVESDNRYNLTKRENEIYELVKKGLTSSEISYMLHLSKHTVDTHRKNILSKTNTRNFMSLVKDEIIL